MLFFCVSNKLKLYLLHISNALVPIQYHQDKTDKTGGEHPCEIPIHWDYSSTFLPVKSETEV